MPKRRVTILLAEDDPDDQLAVAEALAEAQIESQLRTVADGAALMDYLARRSQFADAQIAPSPDLLLLDWNLPKRTGRSCLEAIKGDPELRRLPVVVLTTSSADADVDVAYGLGANSFVTKPITFDGFMQAMNALGQYWLEVVTLPDGRSP